MRILVFLGFCMLGTILVPLVFYISAFMGFLFVWPLKMYMFQGSSLDFFELMWKLVVYGNGGAIIFFAYVGLSLGFLFGVANFKNLPRKHNPSIKNSF